MGSSERDVRRDCRALRALAPHVGLGVGRVPHIQLAEGQEGDLPWQVHLVELHQDFGAHLIRLHNVVKQPTDRKQSPDHCMLSTAEINV